MVYGLNPEGSCGWQIKEILESFDMTSCIRNQMVRHGVIFNFSSAYPFAAGAPADGMFGQYDYSISNTQSPSQALTVPYDVAVDGSGNLFVADLRGRYPPPIAHPNTHHSFYA